MSWYDAKKRKEYLHMPLSFSVPTELMPVIISAVGTLLGVLISSHVAKRTAKLAAAEEIKRMKLTWEREDLVSSDDEFAELAAIITRFVNYSTYSTKEEAMIHIASIRSKETGSIGAILDELYLAVKANQQDAAETLLSEAINEKRNIRNQHRA